jgi:uncharacterized membrane protein YfcA
MIGAIRCPYFLKAFFISAPIGALAGLIGIGGGEFRLPVLLHVIGFNARAAVPLNLIVSLATLSFALMTRSHAVPLSGLAANLPEIFGLLIGGMVSAFYGARLVQHLSDARLVRIIAVLLAALGVLLLAEAVFPISAGGLLPAGALIRFACGAGLCLDIGLVSSMLGVAGGELIIPSLVLLFGVDIKIAGSASIIISLAVVASGLFRYHRMGALLVGRGSQRIAVAMSGGSIIGAVLGGLAIAFAPTMALKVTLGIVLLAAAAKTFREH